MARMRTAECLLVLAALLLGTLEAQSIDLSPTLMERIDGYVSARLERGRIPGAALAVVHGDSIVHLSTFGVADETGHPITPDTPFILGSTSKAITATAVMILVEDGRIELDAPVTDYLPWFRTADADASARISVRNLLTHTSGLSEAVGRERLADGDTSGSALDRHVRALSDVQLAFEPGTAFDYSNANYSALGRVVQEVTGGTFEEFIEESIFGPLGMDHSYTSQADAERAGMATGHRFWLGFPRAAPDVPFARGIAPSGYLISSASDLARFLIVHLNAGTYGMGSLVSPEGIRLLQNPAAEMQPDWSYAMGWVAQVDGDEVTVWHNGAVSNFYSFLWMFPERQLGVAFLANGFDILLSGQFDAISLGVVDLLRAEEPRVRADARFHPPINAAVFWAFLILIWQTLWVVTSILKRRPWIVSDTQRPISLTAELRRIGLPVLLNYGWACVVFLVFPGGQGIPFSVMKLYAPDFGFLVQTSAVVALVWGTVQVALRLRNLFMPSSG